MRASNAGLVEITRDFLEAHRLVREVFARHRAGTLRFEELARLIGDGEESVLFRLKERCHASFRVGTEHAAQPMHREALFDLAVGSLFHEAMKFRENFYQREVYGPRVLALRSQASDAESAIFAEFTRIEESAAARLEEGLAETETLLAQTLEQLRRLLAAHRDDPRVTRFLVEHVAEVESAFEEPFDEILSEIYGDAHTAYERAGCSLLQSGYYPASVAALRAAVERGGSARTLDRLIAYALGMQAYLDRDYPAAVERLREWAEGGEDGGELSRLGRDALRSIGQLAERERLGPVAREALALLSKLEVPRRGTLDEATS